MKVVPGTSIIEILVAAALISVAVIAALSLSNHSQKQSTYAKQVAESSTYATQAIDWVRTQRNNLGWETVADRASTDESNNLAIYCLNAFPQGGDDFEDIVSGSCDANSFISGTFFSRTITLDTANIATGILKVTASITWGIDPERETNLETELTQW